MIKYILVILTMWSVSLSAQHSIHKGDLFVGLNTVVSDSRLIDSRISPMLSYSVSDNFNVGGSIVYTHSPTSNYTWIGLNVRYYDSVLNIKPKLSTFVELSGGVSFNEYNTLFGAAVGVDAWIGSIFYVEPKLFVISTSQDSDVFTSGGLSIGCGLKF